MVQTINFLKSAIDFKVIQSADIAYNFNKFNGGSFVDNVAKTIFAFSCEWELRTNWIDRARGIYSYEYVSQWQPKLPQKIFIDTKYSPMTQYQDNMTQTLYFYGEEILSKSDDYGRSPYENMEGMIQDLNRCSTKEQVIKMVENLSRKAYYEKKCADLADMGLSSVEIEKYFKSKAMFKSEAIKYLPLIRGKHYPMTLFSGLANLQSNRKFDEIANRWGIDHFKGISIPRKTEYCQFLADMY